MNYRQCFVAAVLVMSVLASTSLASGTITVIDFPGDVPFTSTAVYGINDIGEIVGASGGHGFLLSRGIFTTIDFPGAVATSANGINVRGQIVGLYQDPTGAQHNF